MGANPAEPNAYSERMRVIVIEADTTIRDTVTSALTTRGHTVTPVDTILEAVRWIEAGIVDLVVSDLAHTQLSDARLVRSIHSRRTPIALVITSVDAEAQSSKLVRSGGADVLSYPFTDDALDETIDRVQTHHVLHNDTLKLRPYLTERMEFVIPSRVEFLDSILNFISDRLIALRVVEPDSIDVVVALDEAIVNAIEHGNGYDTSKLVTIAVEISNGEARFDVVDEGGGFSEQDVPDPCAPENLLRTSGRGILLIRSVMDDVSYSDHGTRITMWKRAIPVPPKRPSGVAGAGPETSGSQPLN